MAEISVAIGCCAYILGVLLSGSFAPILGRLALPIFAGVWLLLGAIAFFVLPRLWRSPLHPRLWWMAALIGFIATVYVQIRTPAPPAQDISQFLSLSPAIEIATFQVEGKVATTPKLTRSQRLQFNLEVSQVSGLSADKRTLVEPRKVNGTLYVTMNPTETAKALFPGRSIELNGDLYAPQAAKNPGAFDFQQYLKRQGIFAGFTAETLTLVAQDTARPSLMWQIRQRIIQAFVQALGEKSGLLVSAMVMGSGSVNIPHEVADQFRKAGLSHALAASGFQVSLLLQVVLTLTQRLRPIARFTCGVSTLAFYVGLTGLSASVLRAAVMGVAVLLGQVFDRRVNVTNALLGTAALLLLFDPFLLWDLGFQLSFLATLGLLITVPALVKNLDWMPVAIAILVAVPIAAYLWTLPLQLYTFGIVSPYSIPINVLTSLLITVLSLGGMFSALVCLPTPAIGGGLAGVLHFPALGLLKIAELGGQLPGASHAVGSIALWQVLALYSLYGLVWWGWQTQWQKYWSFIGVLCLALVVIPVWYASNHLLRVSVLDIKSAPVFVIQDRGSIGLINSGSEKDVNFAVLPFLQQQGINHIDWALAPHLELTDLPAWSKLIATVPVRSFYHNTIQTEETLPQKVEFARQYAALLSRVKKHKGKPMQLANFQTLKLGSIAAQFHDASTLQMRVGKLDWVLLHRLRTSQQQNLRQRRSLQKIDVLWWSGGKLQPQLLATLHPKVAIFRQSLSRQSMKPAQVWLQQNAVTTYEMNQSGAIQWTPQQGFTTSALEQ